MSGFIERALIGLTLVGALVFGAYLYGVDTTREKFINAQLREEVRVHQRQRVEIIKEVIRWVKVKEKHDANMPALARDIVRRCVLSSGVTLRPGGDGSGVPEDGEGAVGEDPAAGDGADRAWCETLARDYARGVANGDNLAFALGWIRANGGAPDRSADR